MKRPNVLSLSGHRTLGEERMFQIRAGNTAKNVNAASATVALGDGTVRPGSIKVNVTSIRVGLG